MTAEQLALDLDLPRQRSPLDAQERRYLELGILRHRYDLSNHQRGWCVLDWDTAGHLHKGDLVPAWVCCQCGQPELNRFWLESGHNCANNARGCTAQRLRGRGPWAARFARPIHALRVWGRFLPAGARRPEVVTRGAR